MSDPRGSLSDSESSDDDKGGAPIMSIFASYYGIEEANGADNAQHGTIDDAAFDADAYVKDALLETSVENLVKKDSEMIHEIRTLDGEMQKLVYDNYNKFITATETIKEMKKDVYGMDDDMAAVREKMGVIANTSARLDSVFEEKRAQVDKLVRVRRLLQRLEFLSELPERLSAMIEVMTMLEYVCCLKTYKVWLICVLTKKYMHQKLAVVACWFHFCSFL